MPSDDSPRHSKEQRRPLRAESFDSIDDLETVNGNGRCDHHKRSKRFGDDWYRSRSSWRSASGWLRLRNICIVIGVLAALVALAALSHRRPGRHHGPGRPGERPPPHPGKEPAKPIDGKLSSSLPANTTSTVSPWKKPEGFKIIGLIFFGRPIVVEILDCYLKRNLVSNGGFLDEVLFMGHTNNEEDLQWLYKLVQAEPLYRNITIQGVSYDDVWAEAVDDKNMYVKIDDDMVKFSRTQRSQSFCLLSTYLRSTLPTMLYQTLFIQN